MADEGNDTGHHADADDVVADELHQLADDGIEHTSVGHDAEIEDGENEQCSGGSGGIEAGLDHGGEIIKRDPAAQNQDNTEDRGEDDECDCGLGLTLEQCGHHSHNGQQAKQANYGVAHEGYLFLQYSFLFQRSLKRSA